MRARLALAQRLVELDPERTLSRLSLMEGHYRVAMALNRMGPAFREEGWDAIRESVRIGEGLIAAEPQRLQYRVTMAQCLQHAGAVSAALGLRDEEAEIADRLEALAAMMEREDPTHREAARIRAQSLAARARLLRDTGELEAARSAARALVAEFDAMERCSGALDEGAAASRRAWRQWLDAAEATPRAEASRGAGG